MHFFRKNNSSSQEKLHITPFDAKELLTNKEVVLIDVRTEEEFFMKRIEQALLLPVSEIDLLVEDVFPDKTKTYILYCRRGVRSAYAQRIMKAKGYLHVYDLGGILDWPYQTING
jgi:rhodanese-related sulfurtransferase